MKKNLLTACWVVIAALIVLGIVLGIMYPQYGVPVLVIGTIVIWGGAIVANWIRILFARNK